MTRARIAIIAALCALLPSGCGNKKSLSEGLALSLNPSQSIIQPGVAASCLDLYNAVATGTIERSVTEPLVIFNDLTLEWSTDEIFYLTQVRVTLEGNGIVGGETTIVLPVDDSRLLFGLDEAIIRTPNRYSSSDPSRPASHPPCPLVVGGIPLVSGMSTKDFTAKVTVEVIGVADKGGTRRVVRGQTVGSAQWIGL